jgi:hypothetical protein
MIFNYLNHYTLTALLGGGYPDVSTHLWLLYPRAFLNNLGGLIILDIHLLIRPYMFYNTETNFCRDDPG